MSKESYQNDIQKISLSDEELGNLAHGIRDETYDTTFVKDGIVNLTTIYKDGSQINEQYRLVRRVLPKSANLS